MNQNTKKERNILLTSQDDHVDTPDERPEPAHQKERDGEHLREAHEDVRTNDITGIVVLTLKPGLTTAENGEATKHGACNKI